MTVAEILLLGVALSADAFSVTVSNCFIYGDERRSRLLLMPLFFGAFQALMPLLGYYVGGIAAELIERYAGIVTLVILGIIGVNMIREGLEGLHRDEDEPVPERGRLAVGGIFLQAIATSIDAFAVGVTLRAQVVNLPFAVTLIGLTTTVICLVAIVLGRKLGRLLGDRAEIVGGAVLVAIGLRAFLA